MALDGRTEGERDGRTWTKLEFFSARTAGTVYFAEKITLNLCKVNVWFNVLKKEMS